MTTLYEHRVYIALAKQSFKNGCAIAVFWNDRENRGRYNTAINNLIKINKVIKQKNELYFVGNEYLRELSLKMLERELTLS